MLLSLSNIIFSALFISSNWACSDGLVLSFLCLNLFSDPLSLLNNFSAFLLIHKNLCTPQCTDLNIFRIVYFSIWLLKKFCDQTFYIFFPVVLTVYLFLFPKHTSRNLSLLFCFFFSSPFSPLPLLTSSPFFLPSFSSPSFCFQTRSYYVESLTLRLSDSPVMPLE